MMKIILLFVAAALVLEQYGIQANPITENSNEIDNNILKPRASKVPKRRHLTNFVRIREAPEEALNRGVGERTVLTCSAVGNPVPAISWTKNGNIVQDFQQEINEIVPPYKKAIVISISKIVITTSTPGEDHYTCIAKSGDKIEYASSTVYTLPGDDEEDSMLVLQKMIQKPTILYYFRDAIQDSGYPLILPCRVHSLTKTQVYWHDPNNTFITSDDPRMKVLPSGDLMINELLWDDMGKFTCYVNNMYGKDSIQTFVYPTTSKRT